jgi:hypothetical protein
MIGEVGSSNCKPVLLETWCAYKLQLTGVLAVQHTDLDDWTWRSSSCFDRVIKSDWLASFGESVASGSTHFLVQTYDDVYDIVAKDFTFQAGQ